MPKPCEKTLIFIPTFNECDNIQPLYHAIKNLNLDVDLLFLDDNSPDGTREKIDNIMQQDSRVFVIHRQKKLGIGSAHKSGIAWAYQHHYQKLVTMDADFTHSPEYIPSLLGLIEKYDIAVGSRHLMKHSLKNWNIIRKMMTWMAHFMTTHLLKFPYDATNAFRAYHLKNISADFFSAVESDSYSFFFESLHILHFNQCSIAELPIDLPARTKGSSKMSYTDAFKSLYFFLNSIIAAAPSIRS